MAKSKKIRPTTLLLGSQRIPLEINVYARVVRAQKSNRLEIAILINDETTAEQLRSAWGKITQLREKLKQFQGSDLTSMVQALRMKQASLIETGMTYSEVAWEINHDVLVNLCAAFLDFEQKNVDEAIRFMSYAQAHLLALRMKDDEVADWTWGGLEAIGEGHAPWVLNRGPIDKERVRANYRQLYREAESQKLVVRKTSSPKIEKRNLSELKPPHEGRAIDLADSLLAKEPDQGGLPKLNEAVKRHIKLNWVE